MNCVYIFLPAITIRHPFTFTPPIIKIQHRRDGIDAKTVDMVFVKLEQGIADQKTLDLVASVVEHESVPVRLLGLPRIGVLIEMRTIEITESGFVLRKMGGNPIQDDADPVLMKVVDQIHEVGRRAEPACRSKVTDYLISPGAIEGMFHDGHKLDMRKACVVDVITQKRRHLAISKPPVALLGHTHPGTKVDLVNGNWRVERIVFCAIGHPGTIRP